MNTIDYGPSFRALRKRNSLAATKRRRKGWIRRFLMHVKINWLRW